jgi:hypothetical protein
MRVAILATGGCEEIELVAPRMALDNAGARATVITREGRHHRCDETPDKAGRVNLSRSFAMTPVSRFRWPLKGRKLSSYQTIQHDIGNAGREWEDSPRRARAGWMCAPQRRRLRTWIAVAAIGLCRIDSLDG